MTSQPKAKRRQFGRGYGIQRKPQPNRGAYDAVYERERRAMLATATHCAICGEPPYPGNPLTADHVIPITMGGAGGPLQPAHAKCNTSKGGLRQHLRRGRE
jgi:5-methylcytosine-specific restriction endonuclease McrA